MTAFKNGTLLRWGEGGTAPPWSGARPRLWPVIAFVSGVSSLWAGSSLWEAVLLACSLAGLASFGFLWNDLHDCEIDAVNEESRLKPGDALARMMALGLGVVFLAIGIACGYLASSKAGVLAIFISVGLFSYTVVLRRFLVIATVLSAGLSSSPIWVPAVVWGGHGSALLTLAGWASVYLMGREIILDTKDRRGDRWGGRHTVPVFFGARAALAAGFILMGCGLTAVTWVGAASWGGSTFVRLVMVLASACVLTPLLKEGMAALDEQHGDRMNKFVIHSRVLMLTVPLNILVIMLFGK